MRQLNARQKKILKQWAESFDYSYGNPIDNLPSEVWEKVEAINDHETIYQNINRYLNDLLTEKMHG